MVKLENFVLMELERARCCSYKRKGESCAVLSQDRFQSSASSNRKGESDLL